MASGSVIFFFVRRRVLACSLVSDVRRTDTPRWNRKRIFDGQTHGVGYISECSMDRHTLIRTIYRVFDGQTHRVGYSIELSTDRPTH